MTLPSHFHQPQQPPPPQNDVPLTKENKEEGPQQQQVSFINTLLTVAQTTRPALVAARHYDLFAPPNSASPTDLQRDPSVVF